MLCVFESVARTLVPSKEGMVCDEDRIRGLIRQSMLLFGGLYLCYIVVIFHI